MNDSLQRCATFHGLLASIGTPVKARDLVVTAEMFKRAWRQHRHLLRPVAEFQASGRGQDGQLNTTSAGVTQQASVRVVHPSCPVPGAQAPDSYCRSGDASGEPAGGLHRAPRVVTAQELATVPGRVWTFLEE